MSTKITGVRLPDDLREQLIKLAKDNDRKLSQQIVRILKIGIEQQYQRATA